MKILIVANNSKWVTKDHAEVKKLISWFEKGKGTTGFEYDIKHTSFSDIPFSKYTNSGSAIKDVYLGVDPSWYNKNVSIPSVGYDIVLFVMNRKQWEEPNRARGWRTDNEQGPVELQIACNEDETERAGGWFQFHRESAFYLLSRHEILHALHLISGQYDLTHYAWDIGNLELARDLLKIPENYHLPTLIRSLNYLQSLIKSMKPTETSNDKIVTYCQSLLGRDASPKDRAPDDLACAETVSTILRDLFSWFPVITGTWTLYDYLKKSSKFEGVFGSPRPGDIIISPTGMGNGVIKNGHAGFLGGGGRIYSNNSTTGLFDSHWEIEEWKTHYGQKGGYPIFIYRIRE